MCFICMHSQPRRPRSRTQFLDEVAKSLYPRAFAVTLLLSPAGSLLKSKADVSMFRDTGRDNILLPCPSTHPGKGGTMSLITRIVTAAILTAAAATSATAQSQPPPTQDRQFMFSV